MICTINYQAQSLYCLSRKQLEEVKASEYAAANVNSHLAPLKLICFSISPQRPDQHNKNVVSI